MKIWKIGSDITNDLVIKDPNVENHHAEVFLDDSTIYVKDLDTTKGTFVNDWRVKQKVLGPTDKLMIGRERIDIEALILTEPMVFHKPTEEQTEDTATPIFTEEQMAASQLLELPVDAPNDDILKRFKAKYTALKELESSALLASQKEAYSLEIKQLADAKFILTGDEELPEIETTSKTPVIDLSPKRQTSSNQISKKWYQNHQILWGAVGVLFAWSAFLMYDHFSDSRSGLIITPEEKIKFDFLKENFTSRPLKVRNETGTNIDIVGFVGIKSDSTAQGWIVEKIFKEFPQKLKQGEAKTIDIAGKVIFTDIVFDYTDERVSEEPIRTQFAGSLSPKNPDFDTADNALKLRLPNQTNARK